VLGFIFLYKLGDSLATSLSTPFYLDLGYSMTDIGVIAKHAGLWPAVFGGLLGGLWMVRLGINRALWLFGVVQMVTILGFAWLAWRGVQPSIDGIDRAGAGERHCCRVSGRRSGHGGVHGVHCARHQPGVHGHPVCTVYQPGRRSADLHQRHAPARWSSRWAGSVSSSCVSGWLRRACCCCSRLRHGTRRPRRRNPDRCRPAVVGKSGRRCTFAPPVSHSTIR
jgi:hypothetical protein